MWSHACRAGPCTVMVAHLAGERGQDVALEDVQEPRGDLGAYLQDLVEVQQLQRRGKRRSVARLRVLRGMLRTEDTRTMLPAAGHMRAGAKVRTT